MPQRSSTDLPLHSGSAPRWLFDRMVALSEAIAEAIIEEYGQDELLRRLSDPYWFQALGCVLGFDWHSSGVTTTTMGALKTALSPQEHGVAVVGGKGATSRKTPDEIDFEFSLFDLEDVEVATELSIQDGWLDLVV